MTILQLLTPIADVSWLSAADTVRDAFDHLETYELSAAPLVDRTGRHAGTVTQADLRRHVAGAADRAGALATPLSAIERRARNPGVGIDRDPASLAGEAAPHGFVPVVDATGRLAGIIDRRRLLDHRSPPAARPAPAVGGVSRREIGPPRRRSGPGHTQGAKLRNFACHTCCACRQSP